MFRWRMQEEFEEGRMFEVGDITSYEKSIFESIKKVNEYAAEFGMQEICRKYLTIKGGTNL